MKLHTFAKLIRKEYKLKTLRILYERPFNPEKLRNIFICSLALEVRDSLIDKTNNKKLKEEYILLCNLLIGKISSKIDNYYTVFIYLYKTNLLTRLVENDCHLFRVNMLKEIVRETTWSNE